MMASSAMTDTFPTLSDGASNINDVEEAAKNRQVRLDQMLEAKMISDILRANNNLKALKAFRIQNEANYKEKEIIEVRKKEIREPLEAALFENDLLAGKVERREETIKMLRRELLLGSLKTKMAPMSKEGSILGGGGGGAAGRSFMGSEMKDADELKQSEYQDQIAELNIIVDYNQREIAKCKKVIEIQFRKIKSLRDELEQSEYSFQERIRKIDADKDIYFNMIESRENKIDKLMEDLDQVNEELSEANEALEAAQHDKKTAQKLMEEFKVQAQQAVGAMDELKQKGEDLESQLKVLREDHYELSEKYADVQSRYDNLVIELDKMVEEGHYIPQQSSLSAAKSSKPKETVASNTTNNNNNTRRKNKTIRTQDIQKAAGRFSNPKSKGSKMAGDDSTIGSDVSAVLPNSGNADVNGMAASASSAAVGTPANRPTTTGTISSQPLETPVDGENKNNPDDGDEEDDDDARSGDSDGGADAEDEGQDDCGVQPSRRAGRFSIRKIQEDTILHEKLQAHAATRMKEALLQQISDLEGVLQSEKAGRKDDQAAFQQTKESMNMTQKLLSTEIARLNSKVAEQDKALASLSEELQVAQAASKFSNIRHSELVTRLSSISVSPASKERKQQQPEITVDMMREMFRREDELKKQQIETKDTVEVACGPDHDDYVQYDILGYMNDWANVNNHSKAIQCTWASDLGVEREVQLDEDDFFATMTDDHNEAVQEELNASANNNPDDNTNRTEEPKRVPSASTAPRVQYKILKEDPVILSQLEQLYQGFLHICSRFLPPHKQQLVNQEFHSSLMAAELVPSLDIRWQVRHALTFIISLNEMRNQFVNVCFQNNKILKEMQARQKLHSRQKQERPLSQQSDGSSKGLDGSEDGIASHPDHDTLDAESKLEKANVKIVLTIRFIDLILQVVHHLLSPLCHIQESDYPHIEQIFAVVPPVTHEELAEKQALAEESNAYADELQKHVKTLMDTFPLTEIGMTGDRTMGSPRGVLSKQGSRSSSPTSKSRSRSASPQNRVYMNSSTPRTFPVSVDEILDRIERRSRSPSAAGDAVSGRVPPIISFDDSLPGEMDLGAYILDEYEKSGDAFMDNLLSRERGESQSPGIENSEEDSLALRNSEEYKMALLLPHTAIHPRKSKSAGKKNDRRLASIMRQLLRHANEDSGAKEPASPIPSLSTRYRPFINVPSEYFDYTRLAFDKDDIINNAYASERRVHSANATERGRQRLEARLQSQTPADNRPSATETTFSSEIAGKACRPYSAHTPSSGEGRRDQSPQYPSNKSSIYGTGRSSFPFPGLETIESVATNSVAEGSLGSADGRHDLRLNDSLDTAGGSLVQTATSDANAKLKSSWDIESKSGYVSKTAARVLNESPVITATPARSHPHRTLVLPTAEATITMPNVHAAHHPWESQTPSKPNALTVATRPLQPAPSPHNSRPGSAKHHRPEISVGPARFYQPRLPKTLFSSEIKPPTADSSDAQVVDYLSAPGDGTIAAKKESNAPFPPPRPSAVDKSRQKEKEDDVLSVQGRQRRTGAREKVTGAFLFM